MAHRSDMGQGIRTGLAQLMADELEADWSKIVVQQAEGDKKYGDQYTDGSRSIVKNFDRLRSSRPPRGTMLEQAAAEQWGVDPSEVKARDHAVHHAATRSLDSAMAIWSSRGEHAAECRQPEGVKLKDRKDWKYIGKPVPNYDLPDIDPRRGDLRHRRAIAGHEICRDPAPARAARHHQVL